jgi:hypothetical protein
MHIDRTHQITVTREPASAACPISPFGLLFMPTARTLATCSSFGASEARDVSLFGFMGQVVNVFPILPQRHTLIMMPSSILIADAMRIADEERAHLVLNAEIDHLARRLMSLIADTPFSAATLLVLGALKLLPATGILRASGLLFRNLAELLVPLSLEGTDTTSSDNQGFSRVRGDGCKVDFTQSNGCVNSASRLLCLLYSDTDMQFKAMVPDERTATTCFWQIKRKHQGFAPFAHWQHDASKLFGDGLCGPRNGIEPLRFVGIAHLHLGVSLPKLARGLDVGKKGMNDHLYRLAMQGELPLGGLLQFIASGPLGMGETRRLVGLHAAVPHVRGFHLSIAQAAKLRG